ncbi:hypothetical protein LTR10_011793 [Elasticomyces elasticus]|uniref:Major facilitator superfamily (MFS) profile domain-containing protein n=1 Tax=Exophiala sideris TaxID=1016849 RepID=A0ABR0JE65_9EURO|nr:hypothetical protein LTR10_011793 [Elasticomyces elasticus]KAK5031750.1 hypothetical protein LTS07_004370 [Exophiala sideris]KAK5040679.1 hypothetical protein LTR13_002979 [Exophiala sideris]KAK5061987.1 hypothetical protein LTR69_005171 [Exophiala sideris]KAK5184687.1 hypothetical protein LTR44_003362 [Eurotiomycetes sp. CCFEE 6388]
MSISVAAEDGVISNMGRRMSQFQWQNERRGTQIDFQDVVNDAQEAADHEHNMSVWQAIKTYPKACGWSILASTALIMEGYDLVVIGSFYGFPEFQKKYGAKQPDGKYVVSAPWQTGLSNGALIGEILGLLACGILAERMGYRFTIGLALVLVICFIFITFFAVNIQMLLVGEILCGLPWGVFQTITTAYAAEVTPTALRPFLTTYVNLCWVFGQLIGSGVLRGMLNVTSQWGYRIPFALQWMWPLPLLVGITLAPESPWWLVRKGRYDDAERSLRRLTSAGDSNFNPTKTIAMMIHTDELEREISAGTTYWDCFKGTDLRRTEIACVVWMIQTLCGSGLQGYSTQFYENAGLDTIYAFDFQMGQYALAAIGVFVAWALMPRVGRRTLYLYGLIATFIALLITGFLGLAPSSNKAAPWVIGTMLLILTFIYDLSIGPVCYCLVAEISSVRLRSKTIVIARNAYNIVGIVNNILTPRMVVTTAWDWGAKAALFWAGSCFLCIVWVFFRLPEPKGKTYAELDVLFERRVKARDFGKSDTNPFRGDTVEIRRGSVVAIDAPVEGTEKLDVVHNKEYAG